MKVAVIGATGVLGRQLLPRLKQQGCSLRVLLRGAGARLPNGSEWVSGDLFDEAALAALVAGCDTVINLATALKPVAGGVDWAANDRVRGYGTRLLVQACRAAGVRRLIQQSVAFVASGSTRVDGSGPLAPLPRLRSAVAMEAAVAASGLPSTLLLRGGLFWGPGTGMQAWIDSLRGPMPLSCPGAANDWVSLVHVDDMAAAVAAAVWRPVDGCMAVVDGEPLQWRELCRGLQSGLGIGAAAFVHQPVLPSFRIDGAAARAQLGWRPAHRGADIARAVAAPAARA